MMVFIDPITRQRIVTAKHVGDITYDLIGDSTIATEEIPLIGPWSDWTGSNFNPQETSSRTQQMFASTENSLFGQDPQIESNVKLPNLTDTGERKGTHRVRQIKRYAELDANGKPVKFE